MSMIELGHVILDYFRHRQAERERGEQMPIVVKKSGGDFKPAPEGFHQAVCCDVHEPFEVNQEWNGEVKTVKKTRILWQIDKSMVDENGNETGRPFIVSNSYTMSLHERSNLRKDLEKWRGKKFTPEELKGFDLEALIGVNCQLLVTHNEGKDGNMYANVDAIAPLGKGLTPIKVSGDYIRKKDRPQDGAARPTAQADAPAEAEAESLPF